MSNNGYDRYLEFQFDMTGNFFKTLFMAIGRADNINIEKLRLGFPEEVDAYLTFSRTGKDAFLAKCNQDHVLIKDLNNKKIFL